MAISILVLTPIRSFGELIQQALQETDLYRADLVHTSEQALELVKDQKYAVAVLDFDLDPNPANLIEGLQNKLPELQIVAIKFEAETENSALDGLPVSACLNGPFYLPDLLDMLQDITRDLRDTDVPSQKPKNSPFPSAIYEEATASIARDAPEWLKDVSRVAQYLTRLSLESAAQAALITREDQLWAYAGQLPQMAAQELARVVGHYWSRDGGSDLARFIRLDADGGEYMLYATGLGGEYVLSLAFQTEIPFSEIRTQASNLARRLATPPQDDVLDALEERPQIEHEVRSNGQEPDHSDGDDEDFWAEDDSAFPEDWHAEQDDIADDRQAFFEDLLSTIDIPDPDGNSPLKSAALEHREILVDEEEIQPPDPKTDHLSETAPSKLAGKLPDGEEASPDDLGETRPTQVSKVDLEPVNPALHHLTYSCVMVPRLPQHHLVGELAFHLNEWVVQFSLAFGWRLEHISIRPNYLYWMSSISPEISPWHMVRNLRDHISQKIFSEFPRIANENPSGDFWAPGYLIVNGSDPISYQLIQDFIVKTRQRQGAPNSQF